MGADLPDEPEDRGDREVSEQLTAGRPPRMAGRCLAHFAGAARDAGTGATGVPAGTMDAGTTGTEAAGVGGTTTTGVVAGTVSAGTTGALLVAPDAGSRRTMREPTSPL